MKTLSFRLPKESEIRKILFAFILILVVVLVMDPAFAGSEGGEFQGIYDKIKSWVNGYLGKLLALFAFLVGLFYGAIKQNFIVALGGVGIAIMIAVMPALMESLITGVI